MKALRSLSLSLSAVFLPSPPPSLASTCKANEARSYFASTLIPSNHPRHAPAFNSVLDGLKALLVDSEDYTVP
jgi:hypothetical protein